MDHQGPVVRDFMTREPCCADQGLTLADAADRMRLNNIRHLVVMRKKRFVGIVSLADLDLAAALDAGRHRKLTIEVATRGAFTCAPETPIALVAQRMEAEHRDAAIVIDDDDFVLGIFTITDALRALRQLAGADDATPAVRPAHKPVVEAERARVPHLVRTSEIVRSHHAGPTPNDASAFGKLFP